MSYEFYATYETENPIEVVVNTDPETLFIYTYSGGSSGWLPGDPPELEIIDIQQQSWRTTKWTTVNADLYVTLNDWVLEMHYDDMIENARDEDREGYRKCPR